MLCNKKISLIIPCRNEESALISLLKKVPEYVDEVIVVDNNSTDNTAEVARAYGAVVYSDARTTGGIGYGFAHQTGMQKASGDYIVAMDGDDTYPPDSIAQIILNMEQKGIDFVSCSRFPLINEQTITLLRRMGVQILNILAWVLYRHYFQDILTGMWVMKSTAVSRLNVQSGDWNLSPEIKLAALTHEKINFSEMHIPYYFRKGDSKLNMWDTGIKHVLFIFKYKFRASTALPLLDTELNKSVASDESIVVK